MVRRELNLSLYPGGCNTEVTARAGFAVDQWECHLVVLYVAISLTHYNMAGYLPISSWWRGVISEDFPANKGLIKINKSVSLLVMLCY